MSDASGVGNGRSVRAAADGAYLPLPGRMSSIMAKFISVPYRPFHARNLEQDTYRQHRDVSTEKAGAADNRPLSTRLSFCDDDESPRCVGDRYAGSHGAPGPFWPQRPKCCDAADFLPCAANPRPQVPVKIVVPTWAGALRPPASALFFCARSSMIAYGAAIAHNKHQRYIRAVLKYRSARSGRMVAMLPLVFSANRRAAQTLAPELIPTSRPKSRPSSLVISIAASSET